MLIRIAIALALFALAPFARSAYEPPPPTAPPSSNPFIESLVQRAAAAMHREDREALLALVREAYEYEQANQARLEGFRISDNIAELAAGMAPTRQDRLDQLAVAAQGADEGVRVRHARLREEDPWLRAQTLRKRRLWNQTTGFFNYMTSSAIGLASGNTHVLAQWISDLGQVWRVPTRMSAWQRKERTLYEQFLKQSPEDPNAPQARDRRALLDERHNRQMGRHMLKLSELHREAGHPEEGMFYARKAAERGKDANSAAVRAERDMTQPARDAARTMAVAGAEGGADGAEREAKRRLLTLLAAGRMDELGREAEAFVRQFPNSDYLDDALFAQAMARGSWASPDGRRDLRRAMESAAPGSNMARHAANIERSPHTNPKAGLDAARAGRSADRRRFVFTGDSSAREDLALAQKGDLPPNEWVDKLTPVFVIDTAIRSLMLPLGAGPSNEPVREAAAVWALQEAGSEDARSQAAWLARQAEKRGEYEIAAEYLAMAGGAPQDQLARLHEKEARDLFNMVSRIEDPARRQQALEQGETGWAGTRFEDRARRAVERAEREQRIQIRKSDLAAMPALWNGRGLNLTPEWFDGRPENGEIAAAGVVFFAPDSSEYEIALIRDGGTVVERRRLTGRALAETQAALGERALADARWEAARQHTRRRYLPLEIQGSAGAAGLNVQPRLLPYQMDPKDLPLYK